MLFPHLVSPSVGRGENIHNAGLSVEVIWGARSRVDEKTNQESTLFNSHPHCPALNRTSLLLYGQE